MLRAILLTCFVLSSGTCFAAPPDTAFVRVVWNAKFASGYAMTDPIKGVSFTCTKEPTLSSASQTVWVFANGPHKSVIQVRAREASGGKCIWDTVIVDEFKALVSQSHLVVNTTALGTYTGQQYASNITSKAQIKCVEAGTFTISQ